MNTVLVLASSSPARKLLLDQASIACQVVAHSVDESLYDSIAVGAERVRALAIAKAASVLLPPYRRFVLAADTVVVDVRGTVHGKPVNRADAYRKMQILRLGGVVVTGYCLEDRGKERIVEVVSTTFELDMSDAWIDRYLTYESHHLSVAGGLTAEGFGAQFITSITGSYTNVLGLPMAQVRTSLERLGFF